MLPLTPFPAFQASKVASPLLIFMGNSTAFRYRLLDYAGSKSRFTCPGCGMPHKLVPFFDTLTGELLPSEFGRCDRENKCGYFVRPYTLSRSKGPTKGTRVSHHRHAFNSVLKAPAGLTSAPCIVPSSIYQATLGHYERNSLARLLQRHFGIGVAAELCARFHLGTSSHWPGACVFWLLDTDHQVRGGQVVLYDKTGHTVKQPYRHTSWAHTALLRRYKRRYEALPTWLAVYAATPGQQSPCLFGLPQLTYDSSEKPIALVESAKTAIIATPYMPKYIWLATMGASHLTAERLAPLRRRRIVLFPDADAYDHWFSKAEELRREGFDVIVDDTLEQLATPAEREEGLDLADILLREWLGYPPSWDESFLPNCEAVRQL